MDDLDRKKYPIVFAVLYQRGHTVPRGIYQVRCMFENGVPYLVFNYSVTDDIFVAHERLRIDPRYLNPTPSPEVDFVYSREVRVPRWIKLDGPSS